MAALLESMRRISEDAGKEILKIYGQEDFGVETKGDNSPLTAADLAAHQVILSGLTAAFPDIPILSEESEDISFETRAKWERYFLVDPLDGTKEFINRNGEFTVNIALIKDRRPILGVVHVPVQAKTYTGDVAEGRACLFEGDEQRDIQCRAMSDKVTVVASRRHGSDTMVEFMANLEDRFEVETLGVGSSLKFCMLAEGRADLYPRLAPTSEWDTAAAQAVVEAAGGQVVDAQFVPLQYNKPGQILNPHFYVWADKSFGWPDIIAAT